MALPKIAIVIPCYNEEEALPISIARILDIIDKMSSDNMIDSNSYILCCDDGSHDKTWNIITQLHNSNSRIKGISLAHNKGQQYALYAGLMTVKGNCDAAITIDADLQDEPEAISEMVNEFISGKEIVYGVRKNRASDSWFKRKSAHGFYNIQKQLGLDTIYDHADYRLLSNRALELLSEYEESNLVLRGIIPQIGLSSSIVKYERKERVAGQSKYPLKKMLSLSIDGITSFSAKPMRMVFIVGLTFLLADILVALYVIGAYINGSTVSGWTSLMLSIWFLGGLILMSVGIVGEYIGKIFIEVKKRPRYAIKDRLF